MILGTAGHIDHGKTTLVRALTGVDTDRLPEEKRRGITIDLGFAPLVLDGVGQLGVVDVPGHEAFVRTMVAGATGIDLALLVVAADSGVMPRQSALSCAFPQVVYRFQRRSSFRVRPILRSSPVARLRHPDLPELDLSLRVLDVSLGGCALFVPDDCETG